MKSRITMTVYLSAKIEENIMRLKTNYIWNPSTWTCENGKYSKIIIGDTEIKLDKITEAKNLLHEKLLYINIYLFYLPF